MLWLIKDLEINSIEIAILFNFSIGCFFYGISTLVVYLMPNPVFICKICKQIVCW